MHIAPCQVLDNTRQAGKARRLIEPLVGPPYMVWQPCECFGLVGHKTVQLCHNSAILSVLTQKNETYRIHWGLLPSK